LGWVEDLRGSQDNHSAHGCGREDEVGRPLPGRIAFETAHLPCALGF
jgi:hypothetical protein